MLKNLIKQINTRSKPQQQRMNKSIKSKVVRLCIVVVHCSGFPPLDAAFITFLPSDESAHLTHIHTRLDLLVKCRFANASRLVYLTAPQR